MPWWFLSPLVFAAAVRRHCGETGIAAPILDALSALAATASPEDFHPSADMLDDAYDEIVDTLMTKHLAGYQVQFLDDSLGCRSPLWCWIHH